MSKSKWCPQCGAEYLPTMTTCSDCVVALVDRQPTDGVDHGTVEYDLADWDEGRWNMLRFQMRGRSIAWKADGRAVSVPRANERVVDELFDSLEGDHFEVPEVPDAFVLPDGRRVAELPVGPDVPRREPALVGWVEDRAARLRWLTAAVRDAFRRLRR